MTTPSDTGDILRARLEAVRKKQLRIATQGGAVLLILVVLCALLILFVLESIVRFGPAVRTILFWGSAAGFTLAAAWLVGRPLLRRAGLLHGESDSDLAHRIGRSFPAVKDRLGNVLQLARESGGPLYSAPLIHAAVEEFQNETAGMDFTTSISPATTQRYLRFLGVGAVIAVVVGIIFAGPLRASGERLWNYSQVFAVAQPFTFSVTPGDKEVVRGEIVDVVVRIHGAQQDQVTLVSRREGEAVDEQWVLERRDDSTFRHQFRNLKVSLSYTLSAGEVVSPRFRLTIVDRPIVQVLRVELRPPSYTGLPLRSQEANVGDITAIKGTRASIFIRSNKPLARAELHFSDGVSQSLQLDRETAHGGFRILRDGRYRVMLTDSQGIRNADPIDYAVRVEADAPPVPTILVPGTNLDVTEKSVVPMMFRLLDDYGFSRLRLVHRLIQSRYGQPEEQPTYLPIPLPKGVGRDGMVPFTWNLSNLNLVAEDVVQYHLEVFDNDAVSGPKSGVSQSFLFRYPSVEEVLAEVDEEQENAFATLEEAKRQAEEAKRSLEELRQEMQQQRKEVGWQEKQKTEELAQKYEDVQNAIEEAAQTIERMTEQLQNNQLLSSETIQKYAELQKLFQEMKSPELAEALKRLQQTTRQLSPEQMKQALQQLSQSEENLRKSIERTMNLLRRIQIEQKLDEMVRRAESMQERLKNLREATDRASREAEERLPELAPQQEELGEDASQLEKELEDLQKKMEAYQGDMPVEEVRQAREEFERSAADSMMEQAARDMKSRRADAAMRAQDHSSKTIQRLAEQMQQAKNSLQQNQQRQIVNAMRQIHRDLLELSRRQEELKNTTRGLDPQSPRFRAMAQEQMETLRDLGGLADRLGALSGKTFSVSPEMGKSIGEAMHRMGAAMQPLEQRNGTGAGEQQGAAMAALNEAAIQVQNAVNAMMQAGGQGVGMAGFLQRLRQLSGRQQGLNQESQGLTPDQAAAMGRLAAEQGSIRKSLEELAREASASGELNRLLGDLRQIAEEMREVQTDLAGGSVNPQTQQRQERILSRMLDSQRSLQERDFEERRRAETGTNVVRRSPNEQTGPDRDQRERLRRDLLRALEEGYARDYEELIRKYFEILDR